MTDNLTDNRLYFHVLLAIVGSIVMFVLCTSILNHICEKEWQMLLPIEAKVLLLISILTLDYIFYSV